MTPLVNYFVSGRAFFSGAACILLVIGISAIGADRIPRFINLLAAACGMLLIVFSSTPLPTWFCFTWFFIGAAVIAFGRRWILIASAAIITCTAILWQLRYYLPPRLPPHPDDTVYLIGDSISAGLDNSDIVCWPALVQRQYRVTMVDLSFGGATIQSSLDRLTRIGADSHLVFLEIGGNDMLHGTPIAEFERSLQTLFRRVCRPGRTVVMIEIPLPPFQSQYGAVQRRLAHQFGVILIPRRFFSDVLAGKNATLDGLHLTQQGHEKMARMIEHFISVDFVPIR
jgi:acyl-CoA thioesterase I